MMSRRRHLYILGISDFVSLLATSYDVVTMAQVVVCEPEDVPETVANSMILKEGLRFVFQGYAVWLEAEQFPCPEPTNVVFHNTVLNNNDLGHAIQMASRELNVYPIPAPHLTALYGIIHLSEHEVRQRFQTLATHLLQEVKDWPLLEPNGFLADIEIDGINGGVMNMAWIEATFKTSPEHERIIDQIHECFYKETGTSRSGTWNPHISLAYDNEDCPISNEYLGTLIERFPSLAFPRKIQSISLWNLNGTMNQWCLLDRIPLVGPSSIIVSDEESR